MGSSVIFPVVALQLLVCHALSCPPPFTRILGVCLHFTNAELTWCDAQAYCTSIRGELVHGNTFLPLNGRRLPGLPDFYWIGMTDLVHERGLSRSGWRWSDGAIVPRSSALSWANGEPNNPFNDCVCQCYGQGWVCDASCFWKYPPVCQPRLQLNSITRMKHFEGVSIPVGLPSTSYADTWAGTRLVRQVTSKIKCAQLCAVETKDWCVSFYFNQERRQCRLVLYTDRSLNMGSALGWKKFVLK